MTQELILVLDEGTTSTRAILFGLDGTVHGVAQRELTQFYPAPGLVDRAADVGLGVGAAVVGAGHIRAQIAIPDPLADMGRGNRQHHGQCDQQGARELLSRGGGLAAWLAACHGPR